MQKLATRKANRVNQGPTLSACLQHTAAGESAGDGTDRRRVRGEERENQAKERLLEGDVKLGEKVWMTGECAIP